MTEVSFGTTLLGVSWWRILLFTRKAHQIEENRIWKTGTSTTVDTSAEIWPLADDG